VSVNRVAALLGILVALTVLGSSAVAVALPAVGEELGLDLAGRAWVLAAFSLAFSITTAWFGRLADLAGLRLPLRIGILLFAAGSVLAAAAPGFPLLVAGRLLQGAGAGAVLALPGVALLLLPPVARIAPAQRTGTESSLDARGAGLVALLVVGMVLVLQSPSTGAGPEVLAGAGTGGLAAAALLARHVRRTPDGFLPLALVRDRLFVLTAVTGPTLLAPYLGLLLAIPQILADTRGWTPLQVGLTLVPAAMLGAVASRVAGTSAERVRPFRLVAVLAGGSACGLLLAAATPHPLLLVAGLALAAAGFAGGQTALLDSVTAHVAPDVRGAAIGTFNLLYFTGGAIGTAATGGLSGLLSLPASLAVLAVLPAAGVLTALAADRAQRRGRAAPAPAATGRR
jgi:MFS family permease